MRRVQKTHVVVVDSINIVVVVSGDLPQSVTNATDDIREGGTLARISVPALVHKKCTKEIGF